MRCNYGTRILNGDLAEKAGLLHAGGEISPPNPGFWGRGWRVGAKQNTRPRHRQMPFPHRPMQQTQVGLAGEPLQREAEYTTRLAVTQKFREVRHGNAVA